MKNTKITQIETKIKETQNLLTNWTNQIATYHSQLAEIIKQVNIIKKIMKYEKTIAPEALNKNNSK